MSEDQEIKFTPVPPLSIEDMNEWWAYTSNGLMRTRVMTRAEFEDRYPPTPDGCS